MKIAPIIETDRLLLREPILADWPSFAGLMTSDRARYMGGPFSLASAWGVFCHGIALWQLYGVGNLSIELRKTEQCLGQIEINQGPRFPEPELGWQLTAEAEGKGYAFEAAFAKLGRVGWGVTSLPHNRHPRSDSLSGKPGAVQNGRSIRLAERLGATIDEHAPKQDPGDLVYRHLPRSL